MLQSGQIKGEKNAKVSVLIEERNLKSQGDKSIIEIIQKGVLL